jgi:predicted phosphoribosyltransferase/dienelactone hydrolase
MQLPADTTATFRDRREAGRKLAEALEPLGLEAPVVIALPRGGVPVAFEVAGKLGAPLDIILVRKLGAPENPELGIGAISDDGQVILDGQAVAALGVSRHELDEVIGRERRELERRRSLYRDDSDGIAVSGRTVILVDDGLATGSTAVSAARALRGRGATRIVLAVPVGPRGIERELVDEFDEIVCLLEPHQFGGVGRWYEDFSQTPDSEVIELLAESRGAADGDRGEPGDPAGEPDEIREAPVVLDAGSGVRLHGDLRMPVDARGLVIFAHGSGSSRHSPRNRFVASELNSAGFATLLLDLLSEDEETSRGNVFDVELLAGRLLAATEWAEGEAQLLELPIGYFGASTGAAAALLAAAAAGRRVGAVVSRGGRPDLAGNALARVHAPTLLIVGGADHAVLQLNELAAARVAGRTKVAVVPGAGHLFEEPGALDEVADLAADWFSSQLVESDRDPTPEGQE